MVGRKQQDDSDNHHMRPDSRDLSSTAPYQAVIFDFERTLVWRTPDGHVPHYEFMLDMLTALGHEGITSDDWHTFMHLPVRSFSPKHRWRRLTVAQAYEYGLTPTDLMTFAWSHFDIGLKPSLQRALIHAAQQFFASHVMLVDGAAELLKDLRAAGLRTGVITNLDWTGLYALDQLGLREQVDEIIASCEVGLKKPEYQIFSLMLEALDVDPQSALYVGDGGSNEIEGAGNGHPASPYGITSGAGMDTALVMHPQGYAATHPKDRFTREAATIIVQKLTDIRSMPRLKAALRSRQTA